MWIDTRNYEPMNDGEYLVQLASGTVCALMYTFEGGWNTFRASDGVLHGERPFSIKYVVRWFEAPQPPKVPQEWEDEWLHM